MSPTLARTEVEPRRSRIVPHSAAQLADALGIDMRESPTARIDQHALGAIVHYLDKRQDLRDRTAYAWDDSRFWLVDAPASDRSQYFAIGAAINFRFWRLKHGVVDPARGTVQGTSYSGAMYMWRCLRRALDDNRVPLLDASFLARFSAADYATLFQDDAGQVPIDTAVAERIANLRNLGQVLVNRWNGSFFHMTSACGGALIDFCRASHEFRAFDDPLMKLTMLNVILHSGSGVAQFDRDPLPAIDYHLVKQMVRHGVVEPAAATTEKLIHRERLSASEAHELRRMTLVAFVRLCDETGIPGPILDNLWWGNRTKCLDKAPVCSSPATAGSCPFVRVCNKFVDMGTPLERTRYY